MSTEYVLTRHWKGLNEVPLQQSGEDLTALCDTPCNRDMCFRVEEVEKEEDKEEERRKSCVAPYSEVHAT
jgi:hypothetical protein